MEEVDEKALYCFFHYGYKLKDIAKILNLPISVVEEEYKSWLNMKRRIEKNLNT